jgi:hypothetical protein
MNKGFEVSSFFLGTAFKRELYQFVHSPQSYIQVPSLGASKFQIGSVYLSFENKVGIMPFFLFTHFVSSAILCTLQRNIEFIYHYAALTF